MKLSMGKLAALVGIALPVLGHASAARASVIQLTFEGLKDEELVQNYYNGGFGGSGSGPGPNYGVTFGAGAFAITPTTAGGTGNFSNPPAPGDTILFYPSAASATLDYAAGFTTGFSLDYALQVGYTSTLSVYSGLDGTGTLLASTTLTPTPSPYTVFNPIGVSFSGTAESIVFSGASNYVGYDNITFGSATPAVPPAVPEPATAGVALVAGAACLGSRRRRRVGA